MALPSKPQEEKITLPVKPAVVDYSALQSSNPQSGLTQQQELDTANTRTAGGLQSPVDTANLEYAKERGYIPSALPTSTIKTMADGSQLDTATNQVVRDKIDKSPLTVDSGQISQRPTLPTAPTTITQLSAEEQASRDSNLQNEIKNIEDQSNIELEKILGKGKQSMGESRSFLSKIGAIGRTISGAPLETNLGLLGGVQQKINAAIAEEKANRENKINALKSGEQKAINDRIDKLNSLAQTNFDNALKLIQEDRQISQEDRQAKISNLQAEKLEFDLNSENKEATIKTIESMAQNNVPLDSLTLAQISDYEMSAGLPTGTFAKYYQGLLDYAKIASEENKLKVDKLKNDILKEKEALGKTTTKTVKVGSGKTGKTYLITYDANGKELKRELMGASGGSSGLPGSNTSVTPKNTTSLPASKTGNKYLDAGYKEGDIVTEKGKDYILTPEGTLKAYKAPTEADQYKGVVKEMTSAMVDALGDADYITPDNYKILRKQWIAAGQSPTKFDSEFKGFKDPDEDY